MSTIPPTAPPPTRENLKRRPESVPLSDTEFKVDEVAKKKLKTEGGFVIIAVVKDPVGFSNRIIELGEEASAFHKVRPKSVPNASQSHRLEKIEEG